MARKVLTFVSLIGTTLLLYGCPGQRPDGSVQGNTSNPPPSQPAVQAAQREDAKVLATSIVNKVAKIKATNSGTNGAPIMVMEERHDSRATQLQQAIMLVRLHDPKHGLKYIALEGYTKESTPLQASWYAEVAKKASPKERIGVAVRLLKEGEISSAEFMKLAFDDVELVPIETASQYNVEPSDKGMVAAVSYIPQIALKTLPPDALQTVAQKAQALQGLDRSSSQFQREGTALQKYILNQSPWAKETLKKLLDPQTANSLNAEIALFEGIKTKAQEAGVTIKPEDAQEIDSVINFNRVAIQRSQTMVDQIGPVASRPDVAVVAMRIGAAHTDGICGLFRQAGRPYAAITPLAMKRSDIATKNYMRKAKGESLYSGGVSKFLQEALPPQSHANPPVLNQPWLQGKSELYLFTDRIAVAAGGGPDPHEGGNPPRGPGGPGFRGIAGFKDDDFSGKFVFIDPKAIKYEHDPRDGEIAIFEVVLNPNDQARRKTIWVKARYNRDEFPFDYVPGKERELAERMLQKALEELDPEGNGERAHETGSERETTAKVEDQDGGRVKVTETTMAVFASTEAEVRRMPLSRTNS